MRKEPIIAPYNTHLPRCKFQLSGEMSAYYISNQLHAQSSLVLPISYQLFFEMMRHAIFVLNALYASTNSRLNLRQ